MTYLPVASKPLARALVLALTCACAALLLGAAHADAAVFAPTFDQTLTNPSSTGQNTGMSATITKDPAASNFKSLSIYEPPQVAFNFTALGSSTDMCPSSSMPLSTSAFNPASCPAAAKVGTVTINSPSYPSAATGVVYVINKSPIPWFGVDINPTSAPGNPAGVTLRFGFVTAFPQTDPLCDPNVDPCQVQLRFTTIGLAGVAISKIDLRLDGPSRTGSSGTLSGQLFVLETIACSSSLTSKATFTPVTGSTTTVTDTDLVCAPPQFNQTFQTPTAGSITTSDWKWQYQVQPSNLKTLTVLLPPTVVLNFAELGSPSGMCPASSMPTSTSPFNPASCPASAKTGIFTLNSPTYFGPATGDVYLINNSTPFPWIGIDVNPSSASGNPAGVTLRFAFVTSLQQFDPLCDPDVEICQVQLTYTSSGLPNVSTNSAALAFTRPIFTLDPPPCTASVVTTAKLKPFTGSTTTINDTDTISGC
jgi:hypothetical protein